jgi:hypothetical protein
LRRGGKGVWVLGRTWNQNAETCAIFFYKKIVPLAKILNGQVFFPHIRFLKRFITGKEMPYCKGFELVYNLL